MKRVLIIDPSETFIRYLSRIVTKMGFEALTVSDTETGLAMIRKDAPDLVISEMHFGESDGLALCAETAGSPETKAIPIVFVTTDGSLDGRQRAKEAGCSDYLTKPVTISDVHAMLQRNLAFANKRMTPRIRAEIDVELVDGEQRIKARTETIGSGGMLVVAGSERIPVGGTIQVCLHLPSRNEPVKLTGEIVYLLEGTGSAPTSGIGVKFTNLGHEGASCLKRFLEEQMSDSADPHPKTGPADSIDFRLFDGCGNARVDCLGGTGSG